VPEYSPEAIAEHAVALMLAINRNIVTVHERCKNGNFSLSDLLIGFNIRNKIIGIIGAGKIGLAFAKICIGFGSNIIYSF
jgi:D-lactate dehydrogenase